jgi:DNA-directed RNA polymerase beta subunit
MKENNFSYPNFHFFGYLTSANLVKPIMRHTLKMIWLDVLERPKWIDEKGKIRGGDALFVNKGDVIIGKISIQSDKSGNEIFSDCSVVIGKGEEGYIDRIFSTITPNGYKLVKIVIRSLRIPEVGDKFASRAAQKGTVGMVYKQEDMPFTREGIGRVL